MKQMATTLSSLIIDDGKTAVLEPVGEALQTQGRLRDKFGRAITDLRVSVTDRCNYKCVYCRTGNEGAQPGGDARGFSAGWDLCRGDTAEGSAAGYCADHEWASAGEAGAAVEGC